LKNKKTYQYSVTVIWVRNYTEFIANKGMFPYLCSPV
jgi:hypothetical protein